MREDYVSISPAQLRAGGQQNTDYMLDRPPFTRYFWTGSGFEPVSGANTLYTAAELTALAAAGGLTQYATYVASESGYRYWALNAYTLVPEIAVEVTSYVTMTANGIAFSGPCELAGWYCSVAAGNITVYDALSATGTPIVPTTALTVGPLPIFGAGTNGKMALGVGCYVVLSGAATVRMLVQ